MHNAITVWEKCYIKRFCILYGRDKTREDYVEYANEILDGQDKFEDTKGTIRSHRSRKDIQCNDQKKKDKRTNSDIYNITQKTKDRGKRTPLRTDDELWCSGREIFQYTTQNEINDPFNDDTEVWFLIFGNTCMDQRHRFEMAQLPTVINLNVGGKLFATKLTTLRKYPDSMLAEMFNDKITLDKLDKDKDGNYFIDRNGKHFDHILDFLRNDKYLPPKDVILQVLQEAQYFNLLQYVEKLKQSPTIERIERGRGQILQYEELKNQIVTLAKHETEFETLVCLVVFEKAEFNPHRHPDSFSCQTYAHVKNRWVGDEGTGSTHVQVIDATTDRFICFKSACHSLIYDLNQDGYDVTVEVKDGEQFPNKLDNFVYILRKSAMFTFRWSATWPCVRHLGLPDF